MKKIILDTQKLLGYKVVRRAASSGAKVGLKANGVKRRPKMDDK